MKLLKITLISFIVLLGSNLILSKWHLVSYSWDKKIEAHLKRETPLFVFMGSSRVAASIDSEIAKETIQESTNKVVESVNIGQGFTTFHQYFLYLKKVIQEKPELSKNIHLFIEAPNGTSEWSTWAKSKWFNIEQPQYLINVLTFSDLFKYWSLQKSWRKKVSLTMSFLLRPIHLLTYQSQIRNGVLSRFNDLYKNIFQVEIKEMNLAQEGGIQANAASIELIKESAVSRYKKIIQTRPAYQSWTKTVLYDLIKLAKKAGIKLIFYKMPLSSIQRKIEKDVITKKIRQDFRSILDVNQVNYLDFNLDFEDRDFPDLWHLAKDKRPEFTKELMKSYLRSNPSI